MPHVCMGCAVWFVCAVLLLSVHAAPEPACIALHRHISTVHSSDHCAMALRMPKVALLFLVRGELPHKELWRRWFEELGSLAFRGCMAERTDDFMECTHARPPDPLSQQHLFSVRVLHSTGAQSSAACPASSRPRRNKAFFLLPLPVNRILSVHSAAHVYLCTQPHSLKPLPCSAAGTPRHACDIA